MWRALYIKQNWELYYIFITSSSVCVRAIDCAIDFHILRILRKVSGWRKHLCNLLRPPPPHSPPPRQSTRYCKHSIFVCLYMCGCVCGIRGRTQSVSKKTHSHPQTRPYRTLAHICLRVRMISFVASEREVQTRLPGASVYLVAGTVGMVR